MLQNSKGIDKSMIKDLSLKEHISQLIQDKIFLGQYTEKRYVESLQTYRDVIIIESTEDIVPNLWKVKKALKMNGNNQWIGITDDPQDIDSNDCLLWVILNDVPIGKHWFQICAINFNTSEIILKIKCIQPFRSPDSSFNNIDYDFPTLKEIFTYENTCSAFKFSALVFLTIITFIVEAVKFLGEYSLQMGYLILNFIHISSPIWIGFFEFLTNCVYGLYWLIFLLWKSNTRPIPNALINKNNYTERQKDYGPSRQLCITAGTNKNDYDSIVDRNSQLNF